jgi:hypothetical protein
VDVFPGGVELLHQHAVHTHAHEIGPHLDEQLVAAAVFQRKAEAVAATSRVLRVPASRETADHPPVHSPAPSPPFRGHSGLAGQKGPRKGKFGRLDLRGGLLLQFRQSILQHGERSLAVKHVIGALALDLLRFIPRLRRN